jgi:hypothetical protein
MREQNLFGMNDIIMQQQWMEYYGKKIKQKDKAYNVVEKSVLWQLEKPSRSELLLTEMHF